jgi:UDP-glucose 4-epimerase
MECTEACGQIFNVGSDEEITILELAERVCDMTGQRSEIVFVPYEEAYTEGFDDMRRRVPDLSKLQALIGYEQTRDLTAILRDVIAYESGERAAVAR